MFDSARQGGVTNSLLAGGVIVRGATVANSVLASNVRIGDGSTVDEAVILPNARIGSNCRLRRVIVDAGMDIPDGTVAGCGSTLPSPDMIRGNARVILLARDPTAEDGVIDSLRSVA
jgi:glucose-1-phosphate adenylyltransferase